MGARGGSGGGRADWLGWDDGVEDGGRRTEDETGKGWRTEDKGRGGDGSIGMRKTRAR